MFLLNKRHTKARQKNQNELCEICESLDFASLARTELPRSHPISFSLGPLSKTLNRQEHCQFCRLVVRGFVAIWGQDPPVTTVDGYPITCKLRNRAVCVVRNPDAPHYSENFAANEYEYSNCRITVICDKAPPGCPTTVELQVVDDKLDIKGLFDDAALLSRRPRNQLVKINFELVKKWVSHCSEFHGELCRLEAIPQDSKDSSYLDYFRLVDVRRNCIVDAKADWDYIALSYVWGQTQPMLKLVVANKRELYEDGALARDRTHIPQTIRDAMEVARLLGRRYIWIDSLCIMQDEYVEKGNVIKEMDLIYSRAALTFVAASGTDANSGLAGLLPGTRDLDAFEEKLSFSTKEAQLDFMVARSRPAVIIDGSKWNRRGWTYQERLFSHRMLVFTSEQLFYWCGKSCWYEDTVLETDDERIVYEDIQFYRFRRRNNPTTPFMKQLEESSSISMFEEYAKSVHEISSRDLSFQSDILDASAGLFRSLGSSYKPNTFPLTFYFGLPSVWFESALCWAPNLSAKVCRRDATYRGVAGFEVPFPSWSWIGWVGQVEYEYPQRLEVHTPTWAEVEWYKFDHEHDAVIPLQTGTGTSTQPPSRFNSPRPLREKWKPPGAPVDVRKSGVLDELSFIRSETHLLFYSSCARLPVIERDDGLAVEGNGTNPTRQYFIVGESQGWISLDAEWLARNRAPTYEFVVINRSLVDSWKDSGMDDTLNVMLIERSGQIVYRVGLGMVSERVWANAESEWKFFQLG